MMKINSGTIILKIFAILIVVSNFLLADDLAEANKLFESGNYSESLELVQSVIESSPGNANALFLMGKIYFKTGDLEKARENIDNAIKLDRSNNEYREVRNNMSTFVSKLTEASRLFKNGAYEEAKNKYEEIIGENANFVDAYFHLGRTQMALGEVAAAAINLKKAIEMKPDDEKYSKQYNGFVQKSLHDGNELLKRKNYKQAIVKFNQAISLDPTQYFAYYFKSQIFLAERKYSEAMDNITKTIEIKPDYIKAYLVKGNIYIKMNELDNALDTYAKALKINPDYLNAWDKIGFLNYKMKKYEEAIPAYNKVIKLKPGYSKPYANLGAIYIEQKNYDLAVKNLKKASEINKKDYTSCYRLAQAYNEIDNAAEARNAAKSALQIKPNWAPVLFELGVAERRLGNKSAARQAFMQAAKDSKWKKAAEYELESVK